MQSQRALSQRIGRRHVEELAGDQSAERECDGAVTEKTVLAKLRAIFKIVGDRREPFYTDPRGFGTMLGRKPCGDCSRLNSGQRVEAPLDLTIQLDPRYEFLHTDSSTKSHEESQRSFRLFVNLRVASWRKLHYQQSEGRLS